MVLYASIAPMFLSALSLHNSEMPVIVPEIRFSEIFQQYCTMQGFKPLRMTQFVKNQSKCQNRFFSSKLGMICNTTGHIHSVLICLPNYRKLLQHKLKICFHLIFRVCLKLVHILLLQSGNLFQCLNLPSNPTLLYCAK